MPPKSPTPEQVLCIQELWADTPVDIIAGRARCGRRTIYTWRKLGLLDPLPERDLRKRPPTPAQSKRAIKGEKKVTSAPLTPEPLCDTRECGGCKYELVCGLWLDDWRWMGCEWAPEHEVKLAEKDGVLGSIYYVK